MTKGMLLEMVLSKYFLYVFSYISFLFSEAILLLTSISDDNIELQKRAVFENVFDRILTIIHNEGGLLYGNLIVFDCLVLLQNLVRYNYSNQNWFREMGFFSKIKDLLDEVFNADKIKMLQEKQKLVNISAVLEFIRLFVPKETLGNTLNQVLKIVFFFP